MSSFKGDEQVEFCLFVCFNTRYIATYNKTKAFLLERKKGEWILCEYPTLLQYLRSFNTIISLYSFHLSPFYIEKTRSSDLLVSHSLFMVKLELTFTSVSPNTGVLFPVFPVLFQLFLLFSYPIKCTQSPSTILMPRSTLSAVLQTSVCTLPFALFHSTLRVTIWLHPKND